MNAKGFSACLLLTLLLLTPFLNTYANPLTVSTDQSEYNRGNTVNISISGACANSDLGVQVMNPDRGVEFVMEVKTDSDGKASTSFKVPTDAKYGTYTVYVSGCGDTGSTTFKVVEVYVPPPPPPPLRLLPHRLREPHPWL
ncbi:MAG: hypothetical protein JTT13_06210 [Candidatus Brockarchaeota archaeon]|nr:hypothetical protein [Candidatus Brockarchaeota archaeon]